MDFIRHYKSVGHIWNERAKSIFLFLLLQKEVKENVLFGLVWRLYQPDAYLLVFSPQFQAFDTVFLFPSNLHFKVEVNEWSRKFDEVSPVTMVLTWLYCNLLEIPRPQELPILKSACSSTLLNAFPFSCTSTDSVIIWKDKNTWGGFPWNVAPRPFFFFFLKWSIAKNH